MIGPIFGGYVAQVAHITGSIVPCKAFAYTCKYKNKNIRKYDLELNNITTI